MIYSEAFLAALAEDLLSREAEADTWCVFNNTATDAGLSNALTLQQALAR